MTKTNGTFQVLAGEAVPVSDLTGIYHLLTELGIVVAQGYRCILYSWVEHNNRRSWRPQAASSIGPATDPTKAAKSLIARAGATGQSGLYRLEVSPTKSMLKYEIEAVAVFPFSLNTGIDEKRFVLYLDVLRGEETLDEKRVEKLGQVLRGLLSLGGGAIAALLEIEEDRSRRKRFDHSLEGDYSNIAGRSEPMQKILSLVDRIAPTDISVLVTGETGTGKELIARALHINGHRKDGPFEALNCSAISSSLSESYLFGHVAGAFTDAHSDHRGVFELASGGTLFLDEIGEMTLEHQAKLLRVLEQGIIRPLGSEQDRKVDVRIVSATNKNLKDLVEQGSFRNDLYHRISHVTIELPPLRERREDIPELVRAFIKDSHKRVSPLALAKLMAAPWDGNVRELKWKVEVLSQLSVGEVIDEEELNSINFQSAGPTPTDWTDAWRQHEREFLLRLLYESPAQTVEDAARLMGKSRSWLYEKAKDHKIKLKDILKTKAEAKQDS